MTRIVSLTLPLALLLCASAWAQPYPQAKVIAENDKVVVTEIFVKPGESTTPLSREGQINVYLEGGTAEATYADGSKANVTRKNGEARIIAEKRVYSAKNIGATTIHVITVTLK